MMAGGSGTGTMGKTYRYSTKNRLAELEAQKEQFKQDILREEMQRPILTREQISFFLYQFRKTDIQDEERQRLIDSFVNAVYVFDDKIVLTFNYKNGTKTISLAEAILIS